VGAATAGGLATARQALAGRREAALLELPSVRRLAVVLATRCREPSWVRTAVASLERFRALTGCPDLEDLLARARTDPTVATRALARLAAALGGQADAQVAALGFGPKIWFRLGGVAVPWRPLPAARPAVTCTAGRAGVDPDVRVVLLALIGSGLTAEELAAVRVGDLGSLDAAGEVRPEPDAEPLAVRYHPLDGDGRPGPATLTFLSYEARRAVRAALSARPQAADLLVPAAAVAAARTRSGALIEVGNDVNVALCRATGEFFRAWGLPGSRFQDSYQEEVHPR
jgi:hypothetical protein